MLMVYAHRDDGYMSKRSRWKPRKVFCTGRADLSGQAPVEHVVKFRRPPGSGSLTGATALISEVICGELLSAAGANVLERRLVHVSQEFATSYLASDIEYRVSPGVHFGTVRRYDVENGPPMRVDYLANPQEIVDLWVFDTWLCNIDRHLDGNVLMAQKKAGLWSLIAADQSDCFCGSGVFADGTWRKKFVERGLADGPKIRESAMLDCGMMALWDAVQKVSTAAKQVGRAIEEVPALWWTEAAVDPAHVETAINDRARRISDIVNPRFWGNMQDAIKDGIIIGGDNVG